MYGGYQIDQNNGNPNAAIGTLGNFAGLCALCHASGQAWTGANVSAINKFGTPATDWGVGNSNGHSNAVLGGDGSAAIDIYSEVNGRRHPLGTPYTTFNTVTSQSGSRTDSGAPLMSYLNMKSPGYGYGLRQTYFASASAAPQQPAIGASRPYAYQQYQWGAIPIATTQRGYHRFTCSKCHNPHASRLPRLMITNCLDTKVNNWDDQFPSIGTTRRSAENQRVQISQFTSAQNCHRRRDPQFNKTWTGAPTNDGWNNLTPW
jgi:hypothetical protein